MATETLVTLIGSGVTLLGIICTAIISSLVYRESKRISLSKKIEIEINNLNEKKNFLQKKLHEFYYPINEYLHTSKSLSEILKSGKPKGFRTLLFLLNPEMEFEGVGKVFLSDNDKVLLGQIFMIGSKIDELISVKSGIIDDKEFIEPYKSSPEFADPLISSELPLLALTQNHLNIIRLVFKGDLKSEVEKYKSYVYPRELNQRVERIIQKLEKEVESLDSDIKIKLNT
jgi:hypothetical protein